MSNEVIDTPASPSSEISEPCQLLADQLWSILTQRARSIGAITNNMLKLCGSDSDSYVKKGKTTAVYAFTSDRSQVMSNMFFYIVLTYTERQSEHICCELSLHYLLITNINFLLTHKYLLFVDT